MQIQSDEVLKLQATLHIWDQGSLDYVMRVNSHYFDMISVSLLVSKISWRSTIIAGLCIFSETVRMCWKVSIYNFGRLPMNIDTLTSWCYAALSGHKPVFGAFTNTNTHSKKPYRTKSTALINRTGPVALLWLSPQVFIFCQILFIADGILNGCGNRVWMCNIQQMPTESMSQRCSQKYRNCRKIAGQQEHRRHC